MKGLKFISFFAVSGFVLSFLFGLFSHSAFISILLKALLFAVVFAILGFLISIVFEKFLADDTGDFSNEYSSDNGNADGTQTPVSSKGHFVDITIQDEELERSDGNNHFVVGENHQMLTDADVKSQPQAQNENQGFVPLKNFETVQNFSGRESVASAEVSASSAVIDLTASDSSIGGNIDTLPDMNNLDFASKNEDDADDEVDTDTGFDSTASVHKSSDEVPEIKDAALIARAISSVLSDEN